MKVSRLVFFFVALLLSGARESLWGQTLTPEETVTAYYQAFYKGHWEQAAALMHPDALNEVGSLVRAIAGANEKSRNSLQTALGNDFSLDTLDRVDPRSVYAAFLGAMMQSPLLRETFARSDVQVVGKVMEGETAHVVIRMRLTGGKEAPTETMSVHSVRRHDDKWMTLLDEQLSSMQTTLMMLMGVTVYTRGQ